MVNDYVGLNISEILEKILNPGKAYKDKFSKYSEFESTGYVNNLTQILVLGSLVHSSFIQLSINIWNKISINTRLFVLTSIIIYVLSFLAIGTMKGLGDVVLFTLAGYYIKEGRKKIEELSYPARNLNNKSNLKFVASILLIIVATYMAYNQITRAQEFNFSEERMGNEVGSDLFVSILGEKVAFGLFSVLGYPSHGYYGLSLDLGLPFEFSYGAGLSPAFESYRQQYFGGDNHMDLTYPFRGEAITGYPAKMYWSTIFPWIASDITYYGIPLLMITIGYIFAKMWVECLTKNYITSFSAFGLLSIFIAYIPANNQVLMGRQGLISIISIILIRLID